MPTVRRILPWFIAALLLVIILPLGATWALGAFGPGRSQQWWGWMPFFSWMPLVGVMMMIFMLLFWGLVIWGAVALWHWFSGRPTRGWPGDRQNTALEVLRQRYARGEISREEYEERRQTLSDLV